MGNLGRDERESDEGKMVDCQRRQRERVASRGSLTSVSSLDVLRRASLLILLEPFRSSEKYGSPLLQGKRSQFTGIMDHEARRLGVDFRYDAEVTGYSDSQVQPGVMLRGGEMVRGDVSFDSCLTDPAVPSFVLTPLFHLQLIIVCDGAKSSARRLMADDESALVPRQPSGYAIHRSIISSKDIKKDPHCSCE